MTLTNEQREDLAKCMKRAKCQHLYVDAEDKTMYVVYDDDKDRLEYGRAAATDVARICSLVNYTVISMCADNFEQYKDRTTLVMVLPA